ncbi:glycosyltransferase [Pseudolactococcus piscium]
MISENSLVSVIIPLYNRETTIIEAIRSVLNQKEWKTI